MNIILLLGLLGSLASIGSLFIPEKWRQKKITMIILVLTFGFLCGIITFQNSKLIRIQRISSSAIELSNKREQDFTHLGYVQAVLSFLEANKDLFPDSYKRAITALDKFKSEKEKNPYTTAEVSLASEMDGLIEGIAIMTKDK